MVNINKFKDPAVYALHAGDDVFRYIGSTGQNSKTRLYEHICRARSGHSAPVYEWMRSVGIDNVCVTDLEKVADPDLRALREVHWISALLSRGYDLTNRLSRDGRLNSMAPESVEKIASANRGRVTWIKGKRGEEAGWTDQRRLAQSIRIRNARVPNHGTNREYRVYGCRCEDCLEAFATRSRSAPRIPRHGTRTEADKYKCKCDPCRLVVAQRNAQRRGRPIPEVAPPAMRAA